MGYYLRYTGKEKYEGFWFARRNITDQESVYGVIEQIKHSTSTKRILWAFQVVIHFLAPLLRVRLSLSARDVFSYIQTI